MYKSGTKKDSGSKINSAIKINIPVIPIMYSPTPYPTEPSLKSSRASETSRVIL